METDFSTIGYAIINASLSVNIILISIQKLFGIAFVNFVLDEGVVQIGVDMLGLMPKLSEWTISIFMALP